MTVAASMNQDRSTYHFYVSEEGREEGDTVLTLTFVVGLPV